MITIIGRRLIIPDCDRVLGVTEDANTKIKIKLSSDTVERYFPDSANTDNVGITLVMEYEDGTEFSSVAFTKSDDGVHEGYVNLVGVTKVGLLNARALLTYCEKVKDGDTVSTVTTSMQTEEDYFYISEDIEVGDINENGSTLATWSQTLEDIKKETQNLNTAVTTATNAASSASGSAENAGKSESNAEKWATYAEGYKNEALMAKNEAESAKDTAVSAKDEAAGLVGKYSKHLPDNNNPHKVTAEQVGAYTKEEVNKKLGEVDVDLSDYVKNTDYATADKGGVIRIRNDTYGLQIGANDGIAFIKKATDAEIDAKTQAYKPIVPANLEYAVKSVGDGYYVTDTDYATGSKGGVGKISTNFGILVNTNGYFYPMVASEEEIDAGTHKYHIIAPSNLKYAVAKGGEGHFAKEDAVFETGSFGWTEFEYTADEEAFAYIEDNSIVAASSYPITIHCQGEVIGFTASSNGSYYKLKVNGNNVLANTSGSGVSQTYTLPPTLMTEDIVVELSASQIDFTDMTIQSIKGVSELEEQIGDIDTALDKIIDIAESLAPTATLG